MLLILLVIFSKSDNIIISNYIIPKENCMEIKASNSKNALRFINAYNKIESALRAQNNFGTSVTYSEAVRRASRNNSIVRKYEDDLISYGMLRNAIVHNSNDQYVIAEPFDDVVDEYEHIAKLICMPPLAINTPCVKQVKCIDAKITLHQAMVYMSKTGYSSFPVYKDGMLVGVANASKITQEIGRKLGEGEDIEKLLSTQIGDFVGRIGEETFYTIVDKNVTLDKVLNLFAENRKLTVVLVTPHGSLVEVPIGIIVVSDILEINKVLDNYD